MKSKSFVLYASLALNVALLVIAFRPGDADRLVLGQAVAKAGNYAAASSQSGSSRDAMWLADRVSGSLVVFDYALSSAADKPLQVAERRNLRQDLNVRQLGEIDHKSEIRDQYTQTDLENQFFPGSQTIATTMFPLGR